MREQEPRRRSERREPEATEARARGIDLRLVCAVLLGDQRDARGQDRRERQEQACDTVSGRQPNRTDDHRDDETEHEPDDQALEVAIAEPRRLDRNRLLTAVDLEQRLVPAQRRPEVHQLSNVTMPYANVATTPQDTNAIAEPRSA